MIRRYLPALLVCVIVVAGVALVAAGQSMLGAPAGRTSTDAVRLGPEPGQQLDAYLATLPARLPAPGAGPVPALVQLTDGMDAATAAGLPVPGPAVKAVFRVSLTRVQTALRFQ